MNLSIEREKIIDEIKKIPESRLYEIYSLLHYFRVGIESAREQSKSVMQFAGAWSDMSDDVFADFMDSVATRRREAFSGRRFRETNSD